MSFDCMIIAPHPDDAEIGMGGTIAAFIASGKKIVLVDLTDGEPTPFGSPSMRKLEWEKASHALGLKTRINLNLKNREISDIPETRKALASVIREYQPKVLFAPYWEDAHPDHVAAAQLVNSSRFYAKFVKSDMPHQAFYPGKVFHYFSCHRRVQFQPTCIFDITEHIDKKMSALECYESQFTSNPLNTHIFDRIRQDNAYWGLQAGCKYGEPFVCQEALRIADPQGFLHA